MTKPIVKLVGTNGNVFALSGRVRQALNDAGMVTEAVEFSSRLFKCSSYDEALQLMMEYVEVH